VVHKGSSQLVLFNCVDQHLHLECHWYKLQVQLIFKEKNSKLRNRIEDGLGLSSTRSLTISATWKWSWNGSPAWTDWNRVPGCAMPKCQRSKARSKSHS
jgi:hypothetical protein